METFNISPRIDEYLTLMACHFILEDNGEYGFSDENQKMLTERFTDDEDVRACELFDDRRVTDYYMNKVGRLEEHNQWMRKHGFDW
jgi:hypothetical protein